MKIKIQMVIEPNELSEEDIKNMTDRRVIISQYGSSAKASVKKNKEGNYVVTVNYDTQIQYEE